MQHPQNALIFMLLIEFAVLFMFPRINLWQLFLLFMFKMKIIPIYKSSIR